MLGLHRTPEGLETDVQPKNGQTRELVGKVGMVRKLIRATHLLIVIAYLGIINSKYEKLSVIIEYLEIINSTYEKIIT